MTFKAARALLGVSAAADAGELRRAFRAAAKAAHPDRAGGDPERFRQIVAAYHRLKGQPAPADRFIQPPARTSPAPETLSVTPAVAMLGGAVEHRTGDGRKIRLQVPAGLRTGDAVRVAGRILTVAVRGDATALVRGDDLWLTVEVAPRLLSEGGRLALDTPIGRRNVFVPRTAAESRLLRLAGEGLPARGRHARGHLFLRLTPKAEAEAPEPSRSLLRRFAARWAA